MIISNTKAATLAREGTTIGPFKLSINADGNSTVTYLGMDYHITPTSDCRIWLSTVLKATIGVNISSQIHVIDAYAAFVDVIYNHYVEEFFFTNGKVKQSTIHELIRRINNITNAHLYTDHLLHLFYSNNIPLPPEVASRVRIITNYSTTPNSEYKYITSYATAVNSTYTMCPISISMEALGYVRMSQDQWATPDAVFVEYEGVHYFENQLQTCTDCGAKVPHLHSGLCRTCLGMDPALITIRNYNDRAPSFIPFKIGKYSKELFNAPLLFGIELEYESSNRDKSLLDTARLLANHAIFKRDGSIQTGFEIVTTAATFDYHDEVFTKFFDKFPSTLKSASNTGMHIHISRDPLNMLTQGKLVEFMNREDNRTFLRAIAGREANTYTSLDPSRTISYPFLNKKGARYNALNINNEHTLEFRIFATPTDYQTFIQRLDFVNALVAYCSPCQSQATSLKAVTHHGEFTKYVKAHKVNFPHFHKFLFKDQLAANATKLNAFKVAKESNLKAKGI